MPLGIYREFSASSESDFKCSVRLKKNMTRNVGSVRYSDIYWSKQSHTPLNLYFFDSFYENSFKKKVESLATFETLIPIVDRKSQGSLISWDSSDIQGQSPQEFCLYLVPSFEVDWSKGGQSTQAGWIRFSLLGTSNLVLWNPEGGSHGARSH